MTGSGRLTLVSVFLHSIDDFLLMFTVNFSFHPTEVWGFLLLFLIWGISLAPDLGWPPQPQNLKYTPSLAFTTAAKVLQLWFQILLDQSFFASQITCIFRFEKVYPNLIQPSICIYGEKWNVDAKNSPSWDFPWWLNANKF